MCRIDLEAAELVKPIIPSSSVPVSGNICHHSSNEQLTATLDETDQEN